MLGLGIGLYCGGRADQSRRATLTPHKVKLQARGSFIYAGLFMTEGIGLWMAKRWGAFGNHHQLAGAREQYEICRHLSIIKILVLIINLAIVAYLVYRIRTDERTPS